MLWQLFGVMIWLFVTILLISIGLYLQSKAWIQRERGENLLAVLSKRVTTRILYYEKILKIDWFSTLILQLTIIGGGKKPKYDPFWFLLCSLLFSLVVILFSYLYSRVGLVSVVVGIAVFLLPNLLMYIRYLRITAKTRHVFMSFVEGFLQTYVDENKVVQLAFKRMDQRCPEEMLPILEYLKVRLSDGTSFEESIWILADILKFGWAHDFVYILIAAKNGEARSGERALTTLLMQLQLAKNTDLDRGAITKIVFLFMICLTVCIPFFMLLNIGFLAEAKQIYFETSLGATFFLLGSLTILMSFLFAIIWSLRGGRL